MNNASFGKGVFFAVLSFILWGILPLYWKTLAAITSLHLLAMRIMLSLVLVGAILLLKKDFEWLAVFKNAKQAGLVIFTAIMISVNWGLYIWAVTEDHIIEASLGYYINPLLSIILGLIFFREKLSPLQWTAFGIAMLGVLILTVLSGTVPWISLLLAFSFGVYGLLKKKIPLSALESLGAETLAALPIGLFLIFFRFDQSSGFPRPVPGLEALAYFKTLPAPTLILLAFCGAATTLPLYFFARGARLLPLSALGFIQFLSPTLQFLQGILIFDEYFPVHYYAAFACIWIAVIFYIISIKAKNRLNR